MQDIYPQSGVPEPLRPKAPAVPELLFVQHVLLFFFERLCNANVVVHRPALNLENKFYCPLQRPFQLSSCKVPYACNESVYCM